MTWTIGSAKELRLTYEDNHGSWQPKAHRSTCDMNSGCIGIPPGLMQLMPVFEYESLVIEVYSVAAFYLMMDVLLDDFSSSLLLLQAVEYARPTWLHVRCVSTLD